jgi:hypothetical protein
MGVREIRAAIEGIVRRRFDPAAFVLPVVLF